MVKKSNARAPAGLPPATLVIFQNGLRAHLAGRLDEAEPLYRRVLAVAPRHGESLHLLGVVKCQQGSNAEGAALLEQAVGIDAKHPGYRVNFGNALKALGRLDDAALEYRAALRLKRELPDAHNNLGSVLEAQGDIAAAAACYREALRFKADYPEAHNNLGNVLKAQGDLAAAAASIERAMALGGAHPVYLNNLGNVFAAQGLPDKAAACYGDALRLQPNYADARANLGNILKSQGDFHAAAAAYAEALRLAPDHADAAWNDGLLRLMRGDFAAGWELYEARWRRQGATPHGYRQPLWDGRPLNGEAVLLHCEQGYGDSIQFVRFASAVKERGGQVALLCPPALERLFAALPAIDHLATDAAALPEYRWQVPLLSLPRVLNAGLEHIEAHAPYLTATEDDVVAWRHRLAGVEGVKVGIVWRGNPAHDNDRNRSLSAGQLAKLLATPGIAAICLQKDARDDEIAAFAGHGSFHDFHDGLHDFADTAALVSALDLTITVDTSVAHLAGALGKPCWVLLPYVPDWRWLTGRDDSPWYPSLRLFRQATVGDWTGVLEQVAAALSAQNL